ncbi:unnamed protein product [Arabidopsis arenosa]|uniref:Uncharacterized protein n=1 Tax=Arabidopsis arenosa TaxID=38785 RepID=A0A8S2A8Y2_ARAAE|nr:unnamed protein product [Arabidopsis arenosa]
MADSLWDDLQYFNLGCDDPKLFIPQHTYVDAIERNRVKLIARLLNTRSQSLQAVVSSLPRSNHNSPSQNSDNSFPAPLTPSPRLDSPPQNLEEFAATYPQFHTSSLEGFQQSDYPIPRTATWRRQPSTRSTISPNTTEGITPRMPSRFEVGVSSKRPNSHFTNSNDDRKQKTKVKTKDQDTQKGGILKPPKKR